MNETIKAITVTTDGVVEEFWSTWEYQDINLFVGGLIEAVTFGDKPYFAYANEEGKLLGLPENKYATELWYNSGQRILLGDYIAGDVVFFGLVDEVGDNTDAPASLLDELTRIYKKAAI